MLLKHYLLVLSLKILSGILALFALGRRLISYTPEQGQEIPLVYIIDQADSMSTRDITTSQPTPISRRDGAKQLIQRQLPSLSDGPTGLITVGPSIRFTLPPTDDTSEFSSYLPPLSRGDAQTTISLDGIPTFVSRYLSPPAHLVVLSDLASLESHDLSARSSLTNQGYQITIYGLGTTTSSPPLQHQLGSKLGGLRGISYQQIDRLTTLSLPDQGRNLAPTDGGSSRLHQLVSLLVSLAL